MRYTIRKTGCRNGLLLVLTLATLASTKGLSASGGAITVTSTADSGPGTLREALTNAVSGDTISFDPGVFPPQSPVAIALTSPLPAITQGNITLDGTGTRADIDGSGIAEDCDCLAVLSDGNTVQGLRVGGCAWSSIGVHGASNTIAYNVLYGSGGGIYLEDPTAHHNVVIGNSIGTNAAGAAGLGNGNGVVIDLGAHHNTIGGDTPEERNVISGNADSGIFIANEGSDHNMIIGNYIGLGRDGGSAVANGGNGIVICDTASFNVVGGDGSGEGNVISGNGSHGVAIWDPGTDGNPVIGNRIGTDAGGKAAVPNGACGVAIDNGATLNVVVGNWIAYNTWDGVSVYGSATLRNSISRNAITANEGLGINNDAGGNAELAPPVLDSVEGMTVSGTACAGCTLEFFSDDEDEGRTFDGTTTAQSDGTFSFTAGGLFSGPNLTATATDAAGNTSEFSAPIVAPFGIYLPFVAKSARISASGAEAQP